MHRATRLLTATIALIALGATSMAFVHRVGVGSRRLSPPAVAVDFTRLGRDARVPDYPHGVLVLTYHGIASDGSRYAVTPRHFAEQLATLRAAGFHAVSLAQVRALIEGRQPRLPPRPILVTFDDGPRTTWTAADPILARYGFRAAAFVITGRVASRSPSYYLTWGQLRAMRDSGRWEIESHTHAAHIFGLLPDGSQGPVLNNRVVEPGGQEETITHWRARVVEDLQASSRQIRTHLSVTPAAFAYPFSASGDSTDDPRIAAELDMLVAGVFPLAFTDSDHAELIGPWLGPVSLSRLEVTANMTASSLLLRLGSAITDETHL